MSKHTVAHPAVWRGDEVGVLVGVSQAVEPQESLNLGSERRRGSNQLAYGHEETVQDDRLARSALFGLSKPVSQVAGERIAHSDIEREQGYHSRDRYHQEPPHFHACGCRAKYLQPDVMIPDDPWKMEVAWLS